MAISRVPEECAFLLVNSSRVGIKADLWHPFSEVQKMPGKYNKLIFFLIAISLGGFVWWHFHTREPTESIEKIGELSGKSISIQKPSRSSYIGREVVLPWQEPLSSTSTDWILVDELEDDRRILVFQYVTEGYNPTPFPQRRAQEMGPIHRLFSERPSQKRHRVFLPLRPAGKLFFLVRRNPKEAWRIWRPENALAARIDVLWFPDFKRLQIYESSAELNQILGAWILKESVNSRDL